jgi:hypothetical protein
VDRHPFSLLQRLCIPLDRHVFCAGNATFERKILLRPFGIGLEFAERLSSAETLMGFFEPGSKSNKLLPLQRQCEDA